MRKKLNNWAIAIRICWGIIAVASLITGVVIGAELEDSTWFLYCALGAVVVFITSFAFAALLNGVATVAQDVPEDNTVQEESEPDAAEIAPEKVADPKHPDY